MVPYTVFFMFCFALVSPEDLDPGCGLDDHIRDSFSGTATLQFKSANLKERLSIKDKEGTFTDLLFEKLTVYCTKRRDGETKKACQIGELKLYGGGGKITDKGIQITPHSMGNHACSSNRDTDKAYDGTGIAVCMQEGVQDEFDTSFNPPTLLDKFKYKTGNHAGYKKRDMVRWEIYGRTENNNKYLLSKQTSDYPINNEKNIWSDNIPMWFVKDVSSGKCMREINCKLDFSQASVEYDEAAMSLKILYKQICPNTDLVITSTSPYGPDTVEKATTQSGYINGHGQIHLDANHSTNFSLDFVHTSTNTPVHVHSSVLSFLDIDQHADGSVSEELVLKGVGTHYVAGPDVFNEVNNGTLTLRGTKAAEPTNEASSVSIALLDVSHFDMTLSNLGMAVGGRNLMMTGATSFFTECTVTPAPPTPAPPTPAPPTPVPTAPAPPTPAPQPRASCQSLLVDYKVWGYTARGVDLSQFTNQQFKWMGCMNGRTSCNTEDFYCTEGPDTLEWGSKDISGGYGSTMRAMLGSEILTSDPGGYMCCKTSVLGNCLVNSPDQDADVETLCQQLGFASGTVEGVDWNGCPEAHWNGTSWTHDGVATQGYGRVFKCTG